MNDFDIGKFEIKAIQQHAKKHHTVLKYIPQWRVSNMVRQRTFIFTQNFPLDD